MGGHAAGDFASGAIVSELACIPSPTSLGALLGEVRQRLQTVNRQLMVEARTRHEQAIGSTVAALLAFGGHGVVVWAGDSRAYQSCAANSRNGDRLHHHHRFQCVVIRPERCRSKSCRSSILTPAARKRRPKVCLRSCTRTFGKSARTLALHQALFNTRATGLALKLKTCVECFPRTLFTTDSAIRFSTTTRSSPFFTSSPGMMKVLVFSEGTSTSHFHCKVQISFTRQPVLTANSAMFARWGAVP